MRRAWSSARLGRKRWGCVARLTQLFLLITCLLHSLLSLAWGIAVGGAVALLPTKLQMRPWIEKLGAGYLPGGPFGALGALVYQFYQTTPPLWTMRISELEITDRVLVAVPMLLVRLATNAARLLPAAVLGGVCGARRACLGDLQRGVCYVCYSRHGLPPTQPNPRSMGRRDTPPSPPAPGHVSDTPLDKLVTCPRRGQAIVVYPAPCCRRSCRLHCALRSFRRRRHGRARRRCRRISRRMYST